jgi:hypothetical protein
MLERLDEIDWGSLQHAGGSAIDVPDQIRALASAKRETRQEALTELFGNIWHQGTVYDSSSFAVPFLIELLNERAIEDKVQILNLLQCLATGSSYLDAHSNLEHLRERDELDDADFKEALGQELGWVEKTREAVERGIPTYLKLLETDDWQVRLAAAKVLGACDDHKATVAAGLSELFNRETDPRVHFGLLLCLADVGRDEDVELLRAIVGDEPVTISQPALSEETTSPGFLRWAAAIALAQIEREKTTPAAIRIIEETFANPQPMDEFLEEMPWAPVDAVEMACSVLELLPAGMAVPVLLRAMQSVGERSVQSVFWALLKICFADMGHYTSTRPHERQALASLSPFQRQALQAFVARDEAWDRRWGLDHSLKSLGLPDRKEKLQAFIQRSKD